jgi:hypothetical protein
MWSDVRLRDGEFLRHVHEQEGLRTLMPHDLCTTPHGNGLCKSFEPVSSIPDNG